MFHFLHVVKIRWYSNTDGAQRKIFCCFYFPVEIDYEPVGCYRDRRKDRALDKMVKNYRKPKNLGGKKIWEYWEDMSYVIQLCAEESFRQGFTAMFGMQYYGECWSGKDAESNYEKHGKSGNCVNGVGKSSTNYIYRIKGR